MESLTLLIAFLAVMWMITRDNKREEEHFRGIGQCSKACCGTEWKSPFLDKSDASLVGVAGKDYVTSNVTCNGKKGAGCVCMHPRARDLLTARGTVSKLELANF